ncbi:MAG TPA: hypothetical protein VJH94_00410 [Candidatus Paceibacterota bacterium]
MPSVIAIAFPPSTLVTLSSETETKGDVEAVELEAEVVGATVTGLGVETGRREELEGIRAGRASADVSAGTATSSLEEAGISPNCAYAEKADVARNSKAISVALLCIRAFIS